MFPMEIALVERVLKIFPTVPRAFSNKITHPRDPRNLSESYSEATG